MGDLSTGSDIAVRGKGKCMRSLLKKKRKAAGMSQRQVAEYLDVNERYYKKIESGESLGAIWLWDKLEDLLGANQRSLRENHPGKEDSL